MEGNQELKKNQLFLRRNKQYSYMHLIKLSFPLFVLVCHVVANHYVHCTIEKWTVGIPGGSDEADRVAHQNGCKNLGLVSGFSDVYLFAKHFDTNDSSSASSASTLSMGTTIYGPEYEQQAANHDENNELIHRTKRELEAHPCVQWVDRQIAQTRVKRGFVSRKQLLANTPTMVAPVQLVASGAPVQSNPMAASHKPAIKMASYHKDFDRGIYSTFTSSSSAKFNDELWTHQWYLQDNANVAQIQSDIGLKVEDVWKMGFTGKGIVVTILDDGLEWNHTDIYPNYDARASWDMNNNRSDPFPRYDSYDTNSHGTRCAGEVAMVANNRKCGVGVAPRAKIGGIKCLDGEVADHIESMSLLHNLDYIDIYSGSWGPSDNGQVVDGPKRLATTALERGVKYGRQGKGALYVWANGNGGSQGDNCNCDGYVNSIYTISIGGVTQKGDPPFYGERCASTLAVTCSSGAVNERKVVTTDLHNKCTIDYTGTSAAAPLAAGVYALALEANYNLTWRDVQHLTAWTSNPIPLRNNPGWKRNAAGLIFNSRFGFGLLDAKMLVESALSWRQVPKKSICIVTPSTRLPVFLQSRNMAQVVFVSDGCQRDYDQQQQLRAAAAVSANQKQFQLFGQQQTGAGVGVRMINQQAPAQQQQQQQRFAVANQQQYGGFASPPGTGNEPTPVVYLEHVQVIIDVEYTSRGSLDIFLISPSGTVSTLLARRPLDISRNGFDKWPLMSVHFWGESSFGKWTVIVRDKESQNNRGLLRNATLILHGTTIRPAHMQKKRIYEGESDVAPFIDPILEFDEDDIYDLNTFPNDMALVRDDSFQPTFIKSLIAVEKANQQRS